MGICQRINEIISEYKKPLIIAGGIAALTLTYQIKDTKAEIAIGHKGKETKIVTIPFGGDVGISGNETIIIPFGGSSGYGKDGKLYTFPFREEAEKEYHIQLTIDEQIKNNPTNAKLYIQKANEQIKNKSPPARHNKHTRNSTKTKRIKSKRLRKSKNIP